MKTIERKKWEGFGGYTVIVTFNTCEVVYYFKVDCN